MSSAVRDCTDVAKRPLGDKAECEKAASKLRLIYRGEVLPSDGSVYPKGCYSVWNNVLDAVWGIYWNGHKTGSQRKDCFPICYIDGKCTITYGFKVYWGINVFFCWLYLWWLCDKFSDDDDSDDDDDDSDDDSDDDDDDDDEDSDDDGLPDDGNEFQAIMK